MMKNQLINRIMMDGNDQLYNREESFQKLYMVYQLAMNDINISPIYENALYLIDSFIEHEFRERNIELFQIKILSLDHPFSDEIAEAIF